MKNNQISPSQIPHLVRLTADLFREMREETKAPNMNPILQRDEHEHMHFVADLLKDLVDTAYPIEEKFQVQEIHFITVDELSPFKHKDLIEFLKNFGSEGEK